MNKMSMKTFEAYLWGFGLGIFIGYIYAPRNPLNMLVAYTVGGLFISLVYKYGGLKNEK